MSITFGIYDFFSYTIPGVLYILAINSLFQIFKFPSLTLSNLGSDLGYVLAGVVIAYVAGQLMDPLAYRWYLLFNKNKVEKYAIEQLKNRYPKLNIGFGISDRRILFSFIRHNNLELAETIDKFKAISIMLQNLSLGLFLFGLVQIMELIRAGFSLSSILICIAMWAFSFIAIKRSSLYNQWYWSAIFEQALHYGSSVQEMFSKEKEGK
jgi:hypothetical protein